MAFFQWLGTNLPAISQGIGQLGGAAVGAKSVYDLFNRDRDVYEEIPSLRNMLEAAEASRVYAAAAGDPTSPYYQNLAGTYDEENRRNVVAAIRQIQRENARAIARGDPAFGIAPERRDESRAKTVAQLFQLSKERARDEARNSLLGASGASARAAGSYVPSLSVFGRYGDINETMRASGYEGLARMFENVGNFGQGGDFGSTISSVLGGGSPLSRRPTAAPSPYAPSAGTPAAPWWTAPETRRYPETPYSFGAR